MSKEVYATVLYGFPVKSEAPDDTWSEAWDHVPEGHEFSDHTVCDAWGVGGFGEFVSSVSFSVDQGDYASVDLRPLPLVHDALVRMRACFSACGASTGDVGWYVAVESH